MPATPAVPFALAATIGLALWAVASQIGHRAEPWDAPQFWSVFYPLAIIASGVLGLAFPTRPWRWAVTIILMQLPVMALGGSGFGLLPMGLVLLLVLTLPAIGLATLAGWLRKR